MTYPSIGRQGVLQSLLGRCTGETRIFHTERSASIIHCGRPAGRVCDPYIVCICHSRLISEACSQQVPVQLLATSTDLYRPGLFTSRIMSPQPVFTFSRGIPLFGLHKSIFHATNNAFGLVGWAVSQTHAIVTFPFARASATEQLQEYVCVEVKLLSGAEMQLRFVSLSQHSRRLLPG